MPDDQSATGTRRCWHYNRDPQMSRHLIVTVRATSRPLDWLIIGARDMTADEAAEYDRWEADHD
ncbi:hypothetical protein [Micromonospora echinofusca]|uniref:hypothetical protein n=1 Tax=Micromonospora echinofusca TaxID=47858 RepID=UPI000B5B09C0|nr:hypothetical protein [Micromonospora echinofusca]